VGQCPTWWPPCRIYVAPSVQRRKVWLTPTTRPKCSAVTLPRRETRWNLQGCPKLTKGSQLLVSRSSPYYEEMWRRYCCLISFFFWLSIHALVAKTQPDKIVPWCHYGNFLRHFCVLYFQHAACSTFQTCILNSHLGHTMCRSIVDSHSVTAEIRRGKIERRKKKDRRNHRAKI